MNSDIMINVVDKVLSADKIKYCEFCEDHEEGDTLYEMSDWDGGIEFNYIKNIHYCPICGRRLKIVEIVKIDIQMIVLCILKNMWNGTMTVIMRVIISYMIIL